MKLHIINDILFNNYMVKKLYSKNNIIKGIGKYTKIINQIINYYKIKKENNQKHEKNQIPLINI